MTQLLSEVTSERKERDSALPASRARARFSRANVMLHILTSGMFGDMPLQLKARGAFRLLMSTPNPREGEIIGKVRTFYAQRPRPWRWKGAR